jgi:hypothetical protein
MVQVSKGRSQPHPKKYCDHLIADLFCIYEHSWFREALGNLLAAGEMIVAAIMYVMKIALVECGVEAHLLKLYFSPSLDHQVTGEAHSKVFEPFNHSDICLESRFGFMLPDLYLGVTSCNFPNDVPSTVLADGRRSSEKP